MSNEEKSNLNYPKVPRNPQSQMPSNQNHQIGLKQQILVEINVELNLQISPH